MATSGLVILLPTSVPREMPWSWFLTPERAVVSSGRAEATPSVTTPMSDPPIPVTLTTRSAMDSSA